MHYLETKKIAIIGAGIGGILAMQLLKKRLKKANFILIDENDFFVYTPRLTEILSKTVPEIYSIRPTKLFNDKNVKVIIDRVNKVNLQKQEIYLKNKNKINYDIAVFAQGAKTNFFGLKNAEKYCLQFKDYKDAHILRKKIIDGAREKLSIAIIGGGPTGTELSFAIRDICFNEKIDRKKLEISIYQGAGTLINGFPSWFIKKANKEAGKSDIKVYTNHHASDVNNNIVSFKEGGTAKADIIIWVAGITPNLIELEPKIELSGGSMPIRETLQLKNFNNAFAIGDCSVCIDTCNNPYPKTAQIAIQEAMHLANNIVLLQNKKQLKPFTYKIRGNFLALGRDRAAARVLFLLFDGKLGWMLRDLYYRYVFRKLVNK